MISGKPIEVTPIIKVNQDIISRLNVVYVFWALVVLHFGTDLLKAKLLN